LGSDLDDQFLALLVEKTNGNPFFIEQLVLDLRERGLLTLYEKYAISQPFTAEVPPSINAVLIARLDRLAVPIKAVIQTAAVLGQEFEMPVLSQMLKDDDRLPGTVKQAEAAAIWTALSESRYLFRHTLLRDAAYEMQLRTRLRELHRLAATAITQV